MIIHAHVRGGMSRPYYRLNTESEEVSRITKAKP